MGPENCATGLITPRIAFGASGSGGAGYRVGCVGETNEFAKQMSNHGALVKVGVFVSAIPALRCSNEAIPR